MFYQKDISKVLDECQTTKNGLNYQEVEERHKRYGYNVRS